MSSLKGGNTPLEDYTRVLTMIIRIAAAALVAASLAAAPAIAAHAKSGPHAIAVKAVMIGGR